MVITDIIASFFVAALSTMGVGGGGLLIIYLVLVSGMPQEQARGLNLLFFIVASLFSLPVHLKNKRIQWKKVAVFASAGAIGAVIGCILSMKVTSEITKKIFGWFLIIAGTSTLFKQSKTLFGHQKIKKEGNKAT